MKKIFTYTLLAAAMFSSPAFAEDAPATEQTPMFTLTVPADAKDANMLIKVSATGGMAIKVDWGNGTLVDYTLADYDVQGTSGWVFTEVKGVISGTSIKVYGDDASKINYLDLDKDLDDDANAVITAVDVASLTGLKELYLSKNQVKTLDVSKCTVLKNLTASNNLLTKLTLPATETLETIEVSNRFNTSTGTLYEDAGNNQVLTTDWSKASNLKSLKINANTSLGFFGTFNISKNTKLTTLEINGCKLSSSDLNISTLTALKTLNAQWNRLTTIDLSKMVMSKGIAMLGNNQLTSITLPKDASGMTRLNIANNLLTFETLPLPGMTTNADNYVYAPQAGIKTPLSGENKVDFANLAKVGDTASVFVWKDGDKTLVEGTDYNVTDGIFRFDEPVAALTATITNAVFPKLTITSSPAKSVGLMDEILAITIAENATMPLTFSMLSSADGGQDVYVDWGDGQWAGPVEIENLGGYDFTGSDIKATPKGTTIKVKGDAATIINFTSTGDRTLDGTYTTTPITALNLSKLTALQKLNVNVNEIASLDLTNNKELVKINAQSNKLTGFSADLPKLTNLDLSNYGSTATGKAVYGSNLMESIDFEKLPVLKELQANYAGFKADLSKSTSLTTLYVMGNSLKSFAPVSTSLTDIRMQYNGMESFDGTGLTGKVNLFLNANNFSEASQIKFPANCNNANIATNFFTFVTLPALDAVNGTLTYTPQTAVKAEQKDGKVDLTAFGATAYAWTYVPEGETKAVAIPDDKITNDNGVFTFAEAFPGAVCAMTNDTFTKLTLSTEAIDLVASTSGVAEIADEDADAPVEFYNLQGVKVTGNEPGLYIRRQGKKATKVIVK